MQAALFIVGTSIGAGFLSGAELVRFFPCSGYLLPVLLSSAVFLVLVSLFLVLGRKHGGYEGALSALFGRSARGIKLAISLLAFVPCAGMLAGLDALLPDFSPLLSVCGAALVLCFLRWGMRGIAALNAILVPVLLTFVFASAGGGLIFSYPAEGGSFWLGILYSGMNVFLAAPVIMDLGKTAKRPVLSALFAAVFITAAAVCVLGVICREGAGAIGAELPFLYAMRGSKVFYIASALAILTSLGSSLYPLLKVCDSIHKRGVKNAAKGGILLAALSLSRLGLSGIVKFFYPAMGVLGLLLSAVCVFHEYLFEQHHKKVHSRRKHAENTR